MTNTSKNNYYSSPYQNEIWQAQKDKDKIDNEIALSMAKVCAFFLSIGVIYLLFKK